MMSNLRVSVDWREAAVFAGESVECVITFTNITQIPNPKSTPGHIPNHNRELRRDSDTITNARYSPAQSSLQSSYIDGTKGHRHTASLTRFNGGIPVSSQDDNHRPGHDTTNRRYRRSVSIVSIGGNPVCSETKTKGNPTPGRPGKGHGRAASFHILPVRSTAATKYASSGLQVCDSRTSAQKYSYAPTDGSASTTPAKFRSSTSPLFDMKAAINEPSVQIAEPAQTPSGSLLGLPSICQIPPFPVKTVNHDRDGFANKPRHSTGPSHNSIFDQPNQVLTARNYLTKVFSSSSVEGTPRTSVDLYSASNNSSDTLASAYMDTSMGRTSCPPVPVQQQPCHMELRSSPVPEILMMGYGNIVGNFNLDASLINSYSFDEVKKKPVIGSLGGGGVVRAGSTKRQNGLLGSLGWNSLGESLGGLLGGNEMSSIKETTKANDALPVLSTPQSLLFTNLCLEPGQSQSYSFSYRLPPDIPPSHKGKALRVSYNIVIGVQRATRTSQRHIVRTVNFPFRVLPGVDGMYRTIRLDCV